MKHAPNYYEYWSDPKHDQAHQDRQRVALWGEGPFIIQLWLAEYERKHGPNYYEMAEKQA